MNVYGSFTHNSLKVETTTISITRGTDQRNVFQPLNGTLFVDEEEGARVLLQHGRTSKSVFQVKEAGRTPRIAEPRLLAI